MRKSVCFSLFGFCFDCVFDDKDAPFIEQVDGKRDDGEREDIARRGDDGGNNQYHHDGMAPVFLHELGREDTQSGEEPAENGYFKHDTHHQRDGHHRLHVRLEADEVFYIGAYLVCAEEPEREREDEEVAEQYSGHEEQVAVCDGTHDILPFVDIERRGDEPEELVEYVGRCAEHRGIHGGRHVCRELPGQTGVDELYRERLCRLAPQTGQFVEEPIGNEVILLRAENHGKQRLFEDKCRDAQCDDNDNHLYEASPQVIEMFPETLWRVCCRVAHFGWSSSFGF